MDSTFAIIRSTKKKTFGFHAEEKELIFIMMTGILCYVAVCGAFFGGSMLIEKNREVKELKRALERLPEEQKITHRNFRSFTL